MIDFNFSFVGKCWVWQGKQDAWHFLTLPQDKSEEIKFFAENLHEKRRGWGAVRVMATIGSTAWETSIFPEAKANAYLLPLKAEVRKKERISAGDDVKVKLKASV